MTRQDLNFTLAHLAVFIGIYAGSMVGLPKGTWFDWGALSKALLGNLGGAAIDSMSNGKKDPSITIPTQSVEAEITSPPPKAEEVKA